MALTDNIISYYKLDETTGTTVTDSVGNQNGTLQSNSAFGTGKINNGFVTSSDQSSNAGILFGANASHDLSQYPSTISAWFKTNYKSTQENSYMNIFTTQKTTTNYSGFSLFMLMGATSGDRGKINLFYRNSSGSTYQLTTSSTYNDGNWHFVVATIASNGAMKMYIDGGEALTGTTASGALFTSTKSSAIGVNHSGAPDDVWVGSLDEIGFWSRELSSDEVSELYNSGAGLQYPFTTATTFLPQMILT